MIIWELNGQPYVQDQATIVFNNPKNGNEKTIAEGEPSIPLDHSQSSSTTLKPKVGNSRNGAMMTRTII